MFLCTHEVVTQLRLETAGMAGVRAYPHRNASPLESGGIFTALGDLHLTWVKRTSRAAVLGRPHYQHEMRKLGLSARARGGAAAGCTASTGGQGSAPAGSAPRRCSLPPSWTRIRAQVRGRRPLLRAGRLDVGASLLANPATFVWERACSRTQRVRRRLAANGRSHGGLSSRRSELAREPSECAGGSRPTAAPTGSFFV